MRERLIHPEQSIRNALKFVIDVAFGRAKFSVQIPANPKEDADLILSDAVHELLHLRSERDELKRQLAEAQVELANMRQDWMNESKGLNGALAEAQADNVAMREAYNKAAMIIPHQHCRTCNAFAVELTKVGSLFSKPHPGQALLSAKADLEQSKRVLSAMLDEARAGRLQAERELDANRKVVEAAREAASGNHGAGMTIRILKLALMAHDAAVNGGR